MHMAGSISWPGHNRATKLTQAFQSTAIIEQNNHENQNNRNHQNNHILQCTAIL